MQRKITLLKQQKKLEQLRLKHKLEKAEEENQALKGVARQARYQLAVGMHQLHILDIKVSH